MPETIGGLLDRLDAVLREQDGFVTTHQAERLGVRRSKRPALVRDGELRSAARSVYSLAKRRPSPRVDERTSAAWLALDGHRLPWERTEPIVVVSHTSAARLHGLRTLPDGAVEMTSPTRRTTTLPAIRLHVARSHPTTGSGRWSGGSWSPRQRGRAPTSPSPRSNAATCSTRSTTPLPGMPPRRSR